MSRALKIPLVLLLALSINACSGKLKPLSPKLAYTLPVKVKDSWEQKKPLLGTPDKNGDNFSTYMSQGIIVYRDAAGQKVTAIVCSYFKGGAYFKGEIYGISLGDTFPKCTKLWGEPVEKKEANYDFYIASWNFRQCSIEVECWSHPGDDEDLGGKYETDTVKRIRISA